MRKHGRTNLINQKSKENMFYRYQASYKTPVMNLNATETYSPSVEKEIKRSNILKITTSIIFSCVLKNPLQNIFRNLWEERKM
jgi:hypothetical protein